MQGALNLGLPRQGMNELMQPDRASTSVSASPWSSSSFRLVTRPSGSDMATTPGMSRTQSQATPAEWSRCRRPTGSGRCTGCSSSPKSALACRGGSGEAAARGWPATIEGATHKRSKRESWCVVELMANFLVEVSSAVWQGHRLLASCQSCQGDGQAFTSLPGAAGEAEAACSKAASRRCLRTRNRDEFQIEVVRFTKRLGFETVSATVVIDHLLGEAEFITVDNTPRGYRDIVRESQELAPRSGDAALQAAERADHLGPDDLRRAGPRRACGRTRRASAIAHGIAMALHMPEGRHFFLGVDRDQPVPPDPRE